LEEAGASWHNVAKVLIYPSHSLNWQTVLLILTPYMCEGHRPITAIVVEFPDPNLLLELDDIAYLGTKMAINPSSLEDLTSLNSTHAPVASGLVYIGGQTARDKLERSWG
jgi:hypothetical protein